MNIILNLPEEILAQFQTLADKENRSRKNYMETVLINHIQIAASQQKKQSKKK